MSVFRVILSILFPPLAVIDKGCGSFLIVLNIPKRLTVEVRFCIFADV